MILDFQISAHQTELPSIICTTKNKFKDCCNLKTEVLYKVQDKNSGEPT